MAKKTSLCCVLILLHLLSALAKMAQCDLECGSCLNFLGEGSYQVSFDAWNWGAPFLRNPPNFIEHLSSRSTHSTRSP